MKIKLTIEKEFEAKTLLVDAAVRYYEDAMIDGIEDTSGDLIPCKDGDIWKPEIDIETGVIINWEIGKTADIHYKVCSAGMYWLKDENGAIIAKQKGYYVPDYLAPGGCGDGDYIILKINKEGKIHNWSFDVDFEENFTTKLE